MIIKTTHQSPPASQQYQNYVQSTAACNQQRPGQEHVRQNVNLIEGSLSQGVQLENTPPTWYVVRAEKLCLNLRICEFMYNIYDDQH